MPDLAMAIERLLQQRDPLRTLPRAGKRNPEILSSRTVKLLEFGQQSSARNGPDITAPALAEQRSQRPPGIVRRAGAHKIYGGRRSAAAADSGSPQDIV